MNIIDKYKTIYDLSNISIDIKSNNSLYILFFDNELNLYSSSNNFLDSFNSNDYSTVGKLITELENTYNFSIYNYFPVCFINNDSLLLCFRINKKTDKLHDFDLIKYSDIYNLFNDYNNAYLNIDDEMELLEHYRYRYFVYQNIIKKFIIYNRLRRKKYYLNLIKDIIGNDYKSIIDVSCGDNTDLFNMFDNSLLVGNDINLYFIKKFQESYKQSFFTNDDIINAHYKENSFDIAYCKNTLHHLNSDENIIKFLNNLFKISNKIILVEIENPDIHGGLPKFWHKYLFGGFLKDAGHHFLDTSNFTNIINNTFGNNCNIEYFTFKNILGTYMISVIEKR